MCTHDCFTLYIAWIHGDRFHPDVILSNRRRRVASAGCWASKYTQNNKKCRARDINPFIVFVWFLWIGREIYAFARSWRECAIRRFGCCCRCWCTTAGCCLLFTILNMLLSSFCLPCIIIQLLSFLVVTFCFYLWAIIGNVAFNM